MTYGAVNTNDLVVFLDQSGKYIKSAGVGYQWLTNLTAQAAAGTNAQARLVPIEDWVNNTGRTAVALIPSITNELDWASNLLVNICGFTQSWNQARLDATYATNWLTLTGAVTAARAAWASNEVVSIQARTSTWNQAAVDATWWTSWLSLTGIQAVAWATNNLRTDLTNWSLGTFKPLGQETDTLATVTLRGAVTPTSIVVSNTGPNIVSNGTFTTDLSGWSLSGTLQWSQSAGEAYGGQSLTMSGSMYQDETVNAGTYQLCYTWRSAFNDPANQTGKLVVTCGPYAVTNGLIAATTPHYVTNYISLTTGVNRLSFLSDLTMSTAGISLFLDNVTLSPLNLSTLSSTGLVVGAVVVGPTNITINGSAVLTNSPSTNGALFTADGVTLTNNAAADAAAKYILGNGGTGTNLNLFGGTTVARLVLSNGVSVTTVIINGTNTVIFSCGTTNWNMYLP